MDGAMMPAFQSARQRDGGYQTKAVNRQAMGSNPIPGIQQGRVAQAAERTPDKGEAGGSSPPVPTIRQQRPPAHKRRGISFLHVNNGLTRTTCQPWLYMVPRGVRREGV